MGLLFDKFPEGLALIAFYQKLESWMSSYLRIMSERIELPINFRSCVWSGVNVTLKRRMTICEKFNIGTKAASLRRRNQDTISLEVSAKKSLDKAFDNIEVDMRS